VAIKAKYKHLIKDMFIEIGIKSFGDVYAWGCGEFGALGIVSLIEKFLLEA